MLPEIWEPDVTVLFVGTAIDELSDRLGFYYLNPRNRFWELLETGGITPERIITASERKALTEGHARGNLSDPIRTLFIEKKTSQLRRLKIGLTDLNRRILASNDKDKAAIPTAEDIHAFIGRVAILNPKIVGFIIRPEIFVDLFQSRYPGVTGTLGPQPFKIGNAEVWLLGSPGSVLRGEVLSKQEDAFFALGERITSLKEQSA